LNEQSGLGLLSFSFSVPVKSGVIVMFPFWSPELLTALLEMLPIFAGALFWWMNTPQRSW